MAMQRIHQSTQDKAKEIQKKINKFRRANGDKLLTIPDVIALAIDNLEVIHCEVKNEYSN